MEYALTPPEAQVAVYPGARRPNPNVFYGQDDQITVPTQYPRFAMKSVYDVQLSNGWDATDWGKRDNSPQGSYLSAVAAFQPGQTRLYGSNYADFPMQGVTPQQWSVYVQTTAGAQSQYNGGPGVIAARGISNPSSGA